MEKIIKKVIKYLLMSIATTAFYGVLSYWMGEEVRIKYLVWYSFAFFLSYCVLALIAPPLRKLLGYKNEK